MGNACSRSGVSESSSIKVDAPADTLWELILDLDAYPRFLTHVSAIEKLGGEGDVKVGTRYRETREYFGRKFPVNNTVTEIGKDPLQFCVGASFEGAPRLEEEVESTSTLTVLVIDNTSCQLVGTFGYQPGGVRGCIRGVLCRRCLVNSGRAVMEHELDDFRVEAERRYTEQKDAEQS